jgi:hypothetical protein
MDEKAAGGAAACGGIEYTIEYIDCSPRAGRGAPDLDGVPQEQDAAAAPQAIVCANDLMAGAVAATLAERGLTGRVLLVGGMFT